MPNRFWLPDEFTDTYAKKLSSYAQSVYVCMCRHANRQGITFIGARKIAEKMGIHKDTVFKARKQLQVVGLVAPLKDNRWSVTAGGVVDAVAQSGRSGSPKGINPFKETEKLSPEQRKAGEQILKTVRQQLQKKGIIPTKN